MYPTTTDPRRDSAEQPASQLPGRRAGPEKTKQPPFTLDTSRDVEHELLSELAKIGDAEALAIWAQKVLPLKNRLSLDQAQSVEVAFAAKLNELTSSASAKLQPSEADVNRDERTTSRADHVITLSKPVRKRDRNHLRFVASQPCLICGRTPSDAHYLKFVERPAMDRKASDKFTVPVCRVHHRDLHQRGNEQSWWEGQGVDPLPVAATLWRTSNSDVLAADEGHAAGATKPNGNHPGESMVPHPINETKGSQPK